MNSLPKHFDHATREAEIYAAWEDSGAFRADRDSPRRAFFLPMPPPNATGPLHLGHALTLTIEDVMVRWRRMAGDEVLWLPGTDHASIAALYRIQYGPLEVSTHRPEMRLGDTALAVHPDDQRYSKFIGREIKVSWPRRPMVRLRVIPDKAVDPKLGTGVFGVAPGHDPLDFEIGQRHKLPIVTILDEKGLMTAAAGPYAGQTALQCRKSLVKNLHHAELLLEETKGHAHTRYSTRIGTPVEYLIKEQWFIDVKRPSIPWGGKTMSLRQVMAEVVPAKHIRVIPPHHGKNYFHWIESMRDWCISRQIAWGHRVPGWYRGDSETYVGAG